MNFLLIISDRFPILFSFIIEIILNTFSLSLKMIARNQKKNPKEKPNIYQQIKLTKIELYEINKIYIVKKKRRQK